MPKNPEGADFTTNQKHNEEISWAKKKKEKGIQTSYALYHSPMLLILIKSVLEQAPVSFFQKLP